MKSFLIHLAKTLALAGLFLAIASTSAGHLSAQESGVKPIGLVSGPYVPQVVRPADRATTSW